jgi:hypothetical protein
MSMLDNPESECVGSDPVLLQFRDWIAEKYDVKGTYGWMNILLFFHANESQALDKFFELWDEFLTEHE